MNTSGTCFAGSIIPAFGGITSTPLCKGCSADASASSGSDGLSILPVAFALAAGLAVGLLMKGGK